MSTRGLVGFHHNGVTKAQYNHFDSFPGDLGQQVLQDLQTAGLDLDQLREIFAAIVLVTNERERPTPQQQDQYRRFANTGVSESSLDDWYCLLRETQGGLRAWLQDGCRHMIDSADFIRDSVSCEYAYIVDLDAGQFEAYRGFQKQPHQDGRYCEGEPDQYGYYSCRLVRSWPLDQLPTTEELEAAFEQGTRATSDPSGLQVYVNRVKGVRKLEV